MLHGDPISASKGLLLAKSGIRRHRELVAAYATDSVRASSAMGLLNA